MTLRREISGNRAFTNQKVTTAVTGNSTNAGAHVNPATSQSGPEASRVRIAIQTLWRSRLPTSWVSSSTRSRISPTACSLSSASGWAMAASSRSPRSRPSARSTTPAQTVRATVSTSAPPMTHSASRPTSPVAGASASRPATTVPRLVPMAATKEPSTQAAATGPRRRRQSIGWRWSVVGRVDWVGRGVGGETVLVTVGRTYDAGPASRLLITVRSRDARRPARVSPDGPSWWCWVLALRLRTSRTPGAA